jgi:hypothetical protein
MRHDGADVNGQRSPQGSLMAWSVNNVSTQDGGRLTRCCRDGIFGDLKS